MTQNLEHSEIDLVQPNIQISQQLLQNKLNFINVNQLMTKYAKPNNNFINIYVQRIKETKNNKVLFKIVLIVNDQKEIVFDSMNDSLFIMLNKQFCDKVEGKLMRLSIENKKNEFQAADGSQQYYYTKIICQIPKKEYSYYDIGNKIISNKFNLI